MVIIRGLENCGKEKSGKMIFWKIWKLEKTGKTIFWKKLEKTGKFFPGKNRKNDFLEKVGK